jgi:signal peptidase
MLEGPVSVNFVHPEGEQSSPSIVAPKTFRNYLRYVVIGFAAFWILLVGTLALGRLAGFGTVTVLSESMAPVANVNDLMVTRPFDGSVALNDIYVFDSPADGHQTAHRIIAPGSDSYHWVTKGDANESQDMQQITTAAVTSHVVAVIPRFLNFLPFLDSLPGRLLTLTIPFLLMLAPLLKRRAGDRDTRTVSTMSKSHPVRMRVITAIIGFSFLVLVGLRSILGFVVATVPVTADAHGIPAHAIVLLQPKMAGVIQTDDVIQVLMPNALVQTLERVVSHSLQDLNGKTLLLLNLERKTSPSGVTQVQVDPSQMVYASDAIVPYLGAILPGIGTPAGFAAIVGVAGTAGTLLLMYGVASRPTRKPDHSLSDSAESAQPQISELHLH